MWREQLDVFWDGERRCCSVFKTSTRRERRKGRVLISRSFPGRTPAFPGGRLSSTIWTRRAGAPAPRCRRAAGSPSFAPPAAEAPASTGARKKQERRRRLAPRVARRRWRAAAGGPAVLRVRSFSDAETSNDLPASRSRSPAPGSPGPAPRNAPDKGGRRGVDFQSVAGAASVSAREGVPRDRALAVVLRGI